MKKSVWICNVIVCIALVFCILRINSLQNEVNNLSNTINRIDRNLTNDMNNIYTNVQNMLDEQSNQLTISNWEFGEVDVNKKTAEIICTVVPKEYHPNITKAKLISGNNEYLMEYTNGKYVVAIKLPLFEVTTIDQVNLVDNGNVRAQKLNWIISPKEEALLWIFTNFGGSGRGSYGSSYTWEYDGFIKINIERKGPFEIKKIDLVETMNGMEINRMAVDISHDGQQEYAKAMAKNGQAVPESYYDTSNKNTNGYALFIYPLMKEVVVSKGSEYVLYADITDGNDLTYRCVVDCIVINNEGKHDEQREEQLRELAFYEALQIFDKAGNVVYESEALNY